jgi:DNA-binding NarL/FixJ family response regulator
MLRILLADDHAMFRDGLRQLINLEADLVVCGDAAGGAEALSGIREHSPDLVLVDVSLPGESGVDLVKSLKREFDDLPVLVESMHEESLYGERALQAGAMGYVTKSEPTATVLAAIRKVLRGEVHISDKMADAVLLRLAHGNAGGLPQALGTLSDREREVFRLLGQQKGTREIGEQMCVALPTVATFKNRIREKLGMKNSTEVVLLAIHWCRNESHLPGRRRS